MAGATFTIQGIISTTVNDTFTQLALPTGLTGQDTSAFRIKEILLDYPVLPAGLAAVTAEVQLVRGSKVAMANYSDTSLLVRDARTGVQSVSGAFFQDRTKDIVPQGDIIIVETQIFLGFKTAAFAALATLGYKILLEEVKISADQRISILSSRLP